MFSCQCSGRKAVKCCNMARNSSTTNMDESLIVVIKNLINYSILSLRSCCSLCGQ